MDEQEFFNKIKELQKQRDLLKKDVTVLECKINELRDILELKNIKNLDKDNKKILNYIEEFISNILLLYIFI